ncbi:CvpA family protein [Candidatus Kuenenbacteria bacterium]|nr:CvpA family protein [Candidatus Kuenenbacteria bacterium]
MITLDYILLGLILVIAFLGYKKGFLESLGSIIGIIAAVIVAGRYFPNVAVWFGGTNFSNIIAFIVIFSLTIKIVSLLFWVLGKVFKIVTVLPFISSFDRLLGLILGFVEGIFVMSIILYFILKYPLNDWLMWQMSISAVAKVLLTVGNIFVPLFPDALNAVKSFM